MPRRKFCSKVATGLTAKRTLAPSPEPGMVVELISLLSAKLAVAVPALGGRPGLSG